MTDAYGGYNGLTFQLWGAVTGVWSNVVGPFMSYTHLGQMLFGLLAAVIVLLIARRFLEG